MKEMSCFCMTLSSLWEQMVKAYKYITGIFSVTHTSEQQASDGEEQPTKMDVSLLEEQYGYMKQKQKLQSHVIIFKTDDYFPKPEAAQPASVQWRDHLHLQDHAKIHTTAHTVATREPSKGENESVLSESMVNAVLINKNVRRPKSFTECVPVRKARPEVASNGDLQDSSPWRTHLGIHRLAQASRETPSCCKDGLRGFDNERLIPKENGTQQHEELERAGAQPMFHQLGSSSMVNGFSKETSSIGQNSPAKSATSAVWAHQYFSSPKCTSACNKLNFYPFPQKKTPRISEAARRLGLYVSQ